jgi:predicted metal-dependent hydrolase
MEENNELPMILGFVADLYFSVRIESVASRLKYRVKWIERVEEIASTESFPSGRVYGEHLRGPGAELLENITLWRPALIIFDLNNQAVPWREWISLISSVPATRRIPVICFGSHMDIESMKAARAAGAKVVLARSQFVTQLPELIQKFARVVDAEELAKACDQPLTELARRGLEEFNRGEYFEAHEYLEKAWMEDESLGRDLYRAILQVAVAYYQIERRNYNGAMKMFLRMRQWLEPLPDTCRNVDVARLKSQAQRVYEELVALGPQRIEEFDCSLMQPVVYGE